jgi:hypothetical protein
VGDTPNWMSQSQAVTKNQANATIDSTQKREASWEIREVEGNLFRLDDALSSTDLRLLRVFDLNG